MDLEKILVTGLNVGIARDIARKASIDASLRSRLLKAAFSNNNPLNAKAAWTVRHLSLMDPECLIAHYTDLVSHLNGPTDGIKRDLLFTLCELPLGDDDDLGIIVDQCMKWLADAKVALAVKYNCLKMMEKVLDHWPELGDELLLILEDEKDRHSSVFKKQAGTLISRIEQEKTA